MKKLSKCGDSKIIPHTGHNNLEELLNDQEELNKLASLINNPDILIDMACQELEESNQIVNKRKNNKMLNTQYPIVETRGINIARNDESFSNFVFESFERFMKRDWGDICSQDWELNDQEGGRVVAKYKVPTAIKSHERSILIIMDGNITILFPSEY